MSIDSVRWKKISSKRIANCRAFGVLENETERVSDGERTSFFAIDIPDWANVIALTPSNEVVMIEQYRHGTETVALELPGGIIDENEDPETAARRELAEETGYTSEKWVKLGWTHPNPAIQGNVIHHFLALDSEKTADAELDEHEDIETMLVPESEIAGLVANGSIKHSLVLTALYLRQNNDKI